jgi:DNA polymerase IV
VSRLWGVGPKTQDRLHQLGLRTIGSVAQADPQFLSTKLGSAGLHFYTLAHAEDPRPVLGSRMSKSIGSESTLDRDVSDKADIKFHMRRSADVIGRRLRKKYYVAFGVGLKLKTANFQLVSRRHRLSEPTDVAERLYSVAVDLLEHVDHSGPFRLIGLVAYDLVGSDDLAQPDLFNTLGRRRQLEVAIDRLAERFGINVVQRANDLDKPAGMRLAATLDHLEDQN